MIRSIPCLLTLFPVITMPSANASYGYYVGKNEGWVVVQFAVAQGWYGSDSDRASNVDEICGLGGVMRRPTLLALWTWRRCYQFASIWKEVPEHDGLDDYTTRQKMAAGHTRGLMPDHQSGVRLCDT